MKKTQKTSKPPAKKTGSAKPSKAPAKAVKSAPKPAKSAAGRAVAKAAAQNTQAKKGAPKPGGKCQKPKGAKSGECKCGNPDCKCKSGNPGSCECFEKLLNEIFMNLDASELLKDYLFTELLRRGYKEAEASAMANKISVDVNIEGDISIIED